MTSNPKPKVVGDRKSPALKPNAGGLRFGADQTYTMQTDPPVQCEPVSKAASAAMALHDDSIPVGSCKQIVWLTFFFDGTGNNMAADVGTRQHSNVAKLYRAHPAGTTANGTYRIYIPGVGTYFEKVGDNGGGTLGLGAGSMGDARLDWALEQFDETLAAHKRLASSPQSAIIEVNIAVFGFSRGAALARAFVNRLLKAKTRIAGGVFKLRDVGCRLRIRFMGLFDTVASVGVPMSKNNIDTVSSLMGVKMLIASRLTDPDYADDLPNVIAFAKGGEPGADPAPGIYDGHMDWGGELRIPSMVEEVRHFVAAHEIRNSFPVDSISVVDGGHVIKPAHFFETVYPGVHSDIGGSYRAGDGGRSQDPTGQLGLIPLSQMYEHALARQVPLLPKTAWGADNQQDFEIGADVLGSYQYYWNHVTHVPVLGTEINAHMRLYYSWRFRNIRSKMNGDHHEADNIATTNTKFAAEREKLESSLKMLDDKNETALRRRRLAESRLLEYYQNTQGDAEGRELPALKGELANARAAQRGTNDILMKEKAKLDALPDMSKLTSIVSMYDAQLLADTRSIRAAYTEKRFLRSSPDTQYGELRPHYKALIDAYEDEFIRNTGLKDERIVAFFDNYVHDSLSGFAKDATLPSDPRVVYLGGDEKYRYALLQHNRGNDGPVYAQSKPRTQVGVRDDA